MINVIKEKLRNIELQHQVKILYACESGSRAWGFASVDSDFDVRFIYARPLNDYLGIRDHKDVIELPVNEVLDINGWDIKKALKLFLKSNAPLYEWLQSPIVYQEHGTLANELRVLMHSHFSSRAGCHHYLSMTYNTFENDLQGSQVKLKKYFYALRPALACLWIIEKKTVPPMEFSKLRTLVQDAQWHQTVDELLKQKQAADEKALITPIAILQQWIEETLVYCKQQAGTIPPYTPDIDELNALFRKHIQHDL
jgi:predicted nucleotidyltransferase